tara:strand:- start:4860 stop:5690 length:831 start_codon:yes stop_codon:yes gene_type:complete
MVDFSGFKKGIEDTLKPIKKIPNELKKIGDNIDKGLKDAGDDITKGTKTAINKGILKPFADLTAGIDALIQDFLRIVCFLNNIPARFANIGAGFDSVFKGVEEEFVALGYAIELGYNSIASLIFHASLYIRSYLDCATKMITNFGDCFFFYIFEVVGQILYLPFRIIMWVFITFFSFSLYETEKQIWNSIYDLNDSLFPYLGFHIAHYSKSVRDKCYTCVRLRDEVVSFKANQVDKTFKKDIPDIFRRKRTQFKKSQRHLAESVAYPSARQPRYVK